MEQVEASIERYLSALENGGSPGRRTRGSQVGAAEGQDWCAARADAQVQGSGSRRARRAGQADFVDRSGCAIDGDERQGHLHGRLQIVGKIDRAKRYVSVTLVPVS